MFASELPEVIAHGQPGLATADDDGFNLLLHHVAAPMARMCGDDAPSNAK